MKRLLITLLALACMLSPMPLHAGCRDKLLKTAKTKADTVQVDLRCKWQSKIRMTPSQTYGGAARLTPQHYFEDVLLSTFKVDTTITSREVLLLPDSVRTTLYDTTITSQDAARDLAFNIFKEYLVEEASQGEHYLYAFIRNLDLQPVYNRYFTRADSANDRLWYLDLGDSTRSILLIAARVDEQLDAFHVFIADKSPAGESNSQTSAKDILDKIVEHVGVKNLAKTSEDTRKGQKCEMRRIDDVFFEPARVGKTQFSLLVYEMSVFVGGTDGWAYVFAMNVF